jgi:O-antigen ligase
LAKADRIYSRIVDTADDAIEFRQDLAQIALNMVQAHPLLGVGLNSFIESTDSYDPSGFQRLKKFPVHDLYLLEASETGVPGGLAFLAMVILIVWRTFSATRALPPDRRLLPLLISASILGFWFAQVSDFVYRIPILTTILWAHVALVFATARLGRNGQQL